MTKVFTGSKAAVKINGVKIAFIGGLSINEENSLQPIDVIDQLEPAEHAETGHSVSCNFTYFKIDGNSANQIGIRATNIRDILTQPELTIDVYNSVEDRIEYTISGAKFAGGSGSVDARGVWSGQWQFQGKIGGGAGTNSL